MENVRKRAARDVEKAHKFALERFATDLLAVCDSLEMALATDDDVSVESMKEGSEATLKLLRSVLTRLMWKSWILMASRLTRRARGYDDAAVG